MSTVLALVSSSTNFVTNATDPFNKFSADAILRSADNVDFWVRRSILAEASCIFEDMLSLPQPPPGSPTCDELKDGLPVIRVTESSNALDSLLRLCYPTDDPELHTLDELCPVLEAALKYMMQEATSLLRRRLVKLGQSQPLRALAMACSLNLSDEAERLVPLAHSVHSSFVPELHNISAGVYYRVSHYMPRSTSRCATCRQRAQYNSFPTLVVQRRSMDSLPERRDKLIPPEFQDSPTADIVLQASDGVAFRLHSTILSLASPVFQQMITENAKSGDTSVLTLPEESHILATLFEHIYPLVPPESPTSFSTLKALLLAAHKYELAPALSALRTSLLTFIPPTLAAKHASEDRDALRVFALAHRLDFSAERTTAARALLSLSNQDLRNHYVDELEDISAAAYFRLLEYHDRCGHAASACMLAHAISYYGTAFALPSSTSSPGLSASRNPTSSREREQPSKSSASIQGSPGSPSASIPLPPITSTAVAASTTARRSHAATCHVVLDDASDLAWARFRTQSTPRWWIMYVYKLGVALRHRPYARIALDASLRQRAVARAVECEYCRTHFLPGFVEYAKGLARDCEKAVRKVKLEIE